MKYLNFWPVVFIWSLALPIVFQLGSIRLSPYLLVLVLCFLPVSIKWVAGKCGGFNKADFWLLGYISISSVVLILHHGLDVWQFIGLHIISTFCPYLVGRAFVKSTKEYVGIIKVLFWVLVFIVPFAIVEFFTSRLVLNEMFSAFIEVYPWNGYEPRLGFFRAQATFEHPILFGVVCASTFSLFLFSLNKYGKFPTRKYGVIVSVLGTTLSISSGAFISILLQIGLMLWTRLTKGVRKRWWLLLGLFAICYVVIDIFSNRNPLVVLASYMALSKHTAYFRVYIWEYGLQNVFDNPIIGLGLNDWVRPEWMPPSIDNFWLLNTVRYGLVAIFFMLGFFFSLVRQAATMKTDDPVRSRFISGYLFSVLGLTLSLCTVHIWNASYSLVMFLLGSGVWLLSQKEQRKPSSNQIHQKEREFQ